MKKTENANSQFVRKFEENYDGCEKNGKCPCCLTMLEELKRLTQAVEKLQSSMAVKNSSEWPEWMSSLRFCRGEMMRRSEVLDVVADERAIAGRPEWSKQHAIRTLETWGLVLVRKRGVFYFENVSLAD